MTGVPAPVAGDGVTPGSRDPVRAATGARDPAGGSIVTSGDHDLPLDGPQGTGLAVAPFLAVSVTMLILVTALEGLFGAVLPRGLVLPAVLVAGTRLVGLGLWGVLRVNEWRRDR